MIEEYKNIIDKTILNNYVGALIIDVQSDKKYVLHTKQSMLSTVNRDADGYASNFDHFTRKNCVDCNSLWIEKKNEDRRI